LALIHVICCVLELSCTSLILTTQEDQQNLSRFRLSKKDILVVVIAQVSDNGLPAKKS